LFWDGFWITATSCPSRNGGFGFQARLEEDINQTNRIKTAESLQGNMKKTSVLLADRHLALVESIRDLLETLFDTVVMVSDEKSLIETLNRFGPDLVVVDLEMSVTGVPNVANLLNQYDPELKYIILSTHEGREVMEKCKSSGASGYILKRSSAENLIMAVEAVENGGTFFSA
jgi:DNA-binding NarL/FixJ family response regulator